MFAANPFEHVLDTRHWHISDYFHLSIHLPWFLTKYTVLMMLAGLLIFLVYVPLAKKIQTGAPPRGTFWNAFESLLQFIRNEVGRPYLGHDVDHYVHYLWTLFLFILVCNLFGLVPFLGSPTASFTVTACLALCTFFFIHGSAIQHMGLKHHLQSFVPHIDVPFGLGYLIVPMIAAIEFLGILIRSFVLAVRLFANIFAGHVVLAYILFFIVMVKNQHALLFWGVTASSVFGITMLSLLELFVAFLQAFVFTFLTALFLGSALHPEH